MAIKGEASKDGRKVVLFDETSLANASINAVVDTSAFDALLCIASFSGAAAAGPTFAMVDNDLNVQFAQRTINVAATSAVFCTGLGVGLAGDSTAGYSAYGQAELPFNTKVQVGAAGAGVTCRLRIYGIKR